MGHDRKKPVWPWIAALLIGLPVLYLASFGPACWVSSRMNYGAGMIPVVYAPIVKCLSSRKMWLRRTVSYFSKLGAAREWTWRPCNFPPRSKMVMPEHWKWCKGFGQPDAEEARQLRLHAERMRNK